MLLAAYLTTATVVAATGAWYTLKGIHKTTARAMLVWGMGLMAVFTPIQIGFGHLAGEIIRTYQPGKFAAVEGRWESGARAPLIVAAWPDNKAEKNRFEISIPVLGSVVDSGNPDSYQRGIKDVPADERAPFLVPFYGFRIMFAMAMLMLFIGWYGSWHNYRKNIGQSRWFLRLTAISFPIGWIAVMAGWYTAEVGRQPWVVTGLLRTSDAVTPSLTFNHALTSLLLYVVVYLIVYSFGFRYIWNLFKKGPSNDGPNASEAV
jgi:cytochrome d ubiquinol oxidase subunit I